MPQDRTIPFERVNTLTLPLSLGMMALIAGLFALLHGFGGFWQALTTHLFALLIAPDGYTLQPQWGLLLLWVGVIAAGVALSFVLHEALHALGAMAFGRVPRTAVTFGVQRLTPYTLITQPVTTRAYRWGTALPGMVLGLLPALLSLITGSGLLALYGALMFSTAAGDALVLWLLRDLSPDALVRDHPHAVGAQVL